MKTDNELIAEYMGLECPRYLPSGKTILDESDLLYRTSWDWLMPVVQKIVKFQDDNFLNNDWKVRGIYWLHSSFHMMDIATPIDKVYFQVVKFIKWYNQYYEKHN